MPTIAPTAIASCAFGVIVSMLWTVMALEVLMDEFPLSVRARGSEYHRSGAVRILAHSADVIRATVQGTRTYGVKLQHTKKGSLVLSCTCPFFLDRGPCKHLWATALTAADRGILATMPMPARIELKDDIDGDRESIDVQRGDVWSSLVASQLPPMQAPPPRVPPRQTRSVTSRPPELWERLFAEAQMQMGPATVATRPIVRELLYVVDVDATKRGELTMLLMERPRRKDGSWGKEKTARVPVGELPVLSDERDREILPLLQTAHQASGAYGYYGYSETDFPREVRVPASMAAMLMPRIAATGRLHLRTGPGELKAASYDGERPWALALVVERDVADPTTDVVGRLCRGSESVDLDEPLVLTRSGWVVFSDRVSRFDDFRAFGLVVTLREHHRIRVPRDQEGHLLARLLDMPNVPRLVLPEALALREIAATPQPFLKIGLPEPRRHNWATSQHPVADLLFDYHGELVPSHDVRSVVPRIAERTLIRRDLPFESAAQLRLAELGFRPTRPQPWLGQNQTTGFEVPTRKVPSAVRALLADGWQVEADGRLYRRPGRFALDVTSGVDWFDLTATVDFDGVRAGLPELLRALRRGESTVVLGDGSLGILPAEWLAKYGFLNDLGTIEGERLRFRRNQAGLLDAALVAIEDDADKRVDEVFTRARAELARFEGIRPGAKPRGFRGELRPYQKVGLGWMAFLRRFGFGGCLADDMGLGKTIQVLAMLANRRNETNRPSLVVVPKSLVWNWQHEAARFVPKLRVLAHVGAERASKTEPLLDADLVITTYGTLRNDAMLLRTIEFDYLILDEAQAIKNVDSESAKAARLLRGAHRLALSGTPVENHVGELWSLFEFLNPGMLGTSRVFQGATSSARPAPEVIATLARALRPFILRRTKEAVAPELPPKHEETILCVLEPKQRKLYQELRDHYRANLLGRIEQQGMGKVKLQVLEALLRLRQAACHPGLVDHKHAGETCAKLDVLVPRLLELREEGHKALVFSQFTSFLALLRAQLDAAKVTYDYLDGRTQDRQARVARFQTDPECGLFLISLKAGGVGLNLTAADYVFILDPWWNPAVEAQAVDRAHRIGQSKRVFVYRLLAQETVEEKVAELQNSKRGLAESIITGDNSLIRELDRETLEELLA
jgi:superfamily II DNA or RNA helicase